MALTGLGVVIGLLIALLVIIGARGEESHGGEAAGPVEWTPEQIGNQIDRWANREERAQDRVWRRPGVEDPAAPGVERTIRQVVESDLLESTFTNLHWDAMERIGWRAFRQEASIYEVQFVLRDQGVDVGPAWLVQLDPDGLQPEGSGGVVAANLFAQVVEQGASADLQRFLNREDEVVQALTNHQFDRGARLTSAVLVYFATHHPGITGDDLIGWTVVPERIIPDELTLYRAFLQWRTGDQIVAAQWEVNLDTRQFRSLNLMATEILSTGDAIDVDALANLRPTQLPENPPRRHRNLFAALRRVVDNDRLLESVSSRLWQ